MSDAIGYACDTPRRPADDAHFLDGERARSTHDNGEHVKRPVKHVLFLATALSCSTLGFGVHAAAAAPVLTTLVSFTGPNGALPLGTPTFDLDGNLYGTTGFGGSGSGFGQGTVFELSGTDHTTLTTLVSFNGANGTQPQGGLVFDVFGNLFGTTTAGGPGGDGTAFELSGTGH